MKTYTYEKTETGFAMLEPNGDLADWPEVGTEAEAKKLVKEFNKETAEAAADEANEAKRMARMAGDLEA